MASTVEVVNFVTKAVKFVYSIIFTISFNLFGVFNFCTVVGRHLLDSILHDLDLLVPSRHLG